MITFKELIQAGLHYGHQSSRWCPRMEPYIWGIKDEIHLIDISKTMHELQKAAKFLESVAAEGKQILWVGTKKAARESVRRVAQENNCPYVTHRWIGGTLTNHGQVKKSVTKLLHYEDILAKSEQYPYTKKELNTFQKIAHRLAENVGGIRDLSWPIGALVIIDIKRENTALREAVVSGVPVVALVDTNSDPSMVDYVIPGNDDAPRAVNLVLDALGGAVHKGYEAHRAIAHQKKQEEQANKELSRKTGSAKEVSAESHDNDEAETASNVKAKPKTVAGDEKEPIKNRATPKEKDPKVAASSDK